METIWKYHLPEYPGEFTIELPSNAELLAVQIQGDAPVLWALVDPDRPKITKHFEWVFTGDSPTESIAPTVDRYIETVQLHGGSIVMHLFHGTVEDVSTPVMVA